MAIPISLSIPRKLGRAEARRRIADGFAKMAHVLPGGDCCIERRDGNRLTFKVSGLGQTASGVIEVVETPVSMQVELPLCSPMVSRAAFRRLASRC